MKRWPYLIFCFLMIACNAQKLQETPSVSDMKASKWLQSEDVKLSIPSVQVDSLIFSNGANLMADHPMAEAGIEYCQLPKDTVFYPLNEKNLRLDNSATLGLRANHPEYQPSDLVEISMHKINRKIAWNIGTVCSISNEKYRGLGLDALRNFTFASTDFKSEEWLGYDVKNLRFDLKFEEAIDFPTLLIGYLCDVDSWIFPPKIIEVYSEDNLIAFYQLRVSHLDEAPQHEFVELKLPVSEISEISIRIQTLDQIPEGHPGAGTNAWFFMDEIIVH